MAHELYINVRGKASMAYVNDEPWHGLGQKLSAGASLDVWAREAGMDYSLLDSPVSYKTPEGLPAVYPNRKILMRSDTGAALGIVGDKYKVVQPLEVLEFFRDLTEQGGFELETAGVMFGGAKYWALARTGHEAKIGKGKNNDPINGYLLLATACDGTLQTTAQFTSVRVVCNNTLTAAVAGSDAKDLNAVKVSHRSTFDPKKVKEELGLDTAWTSFIEGVRQLAETPVTDKQALQFVVDLVGKPDRELVDQQENMKAVATVMQLFKGKGRGSELKTAAGTAWGLVNGITEYIDFLAGENQDNRLRLAWHYDGAYTKNEAFQKALREFAHS